MIRWSYALVGPQIERMEMVYHEGPLPSEEITKLLGGPYHVQQLRDSTAIACLDDQSGQPNEHYQKAVRGPVIVGKVDPAGNFVGVVGIKCD